MTGRNSMSDCHEEAAETDFDVLVVMRVQLRSTRNPVQQARRAAGAQGSHERGSTHGRRPGESDGLVREGDRDPGGLPVHERESGPFRHRHDGPCARCLPERLLRVASTSTVSSCRWTWPRTFTQPAGTSSSGTRVKSRSGSPGSRFTPHTASNARRRRRMCALSWFPATRIFAARPGPEAVDSSRPPGGPW